MSDGTATVSDKVTVTITDSANTAPTVNAGDDQEAAEGATVNLDGTASDVDTEDTLEYSWSHNSTLTITLGDDEALDTSFTAPNVAEDTAIEFTLTVSDGTATVSDKVTVTITDSANTAPTVNAGDDQEAAEGATVNLDGTASDVDTEDTLEYSWSHNSTLTITLGDDEALDTSFTAPNVAEDTAVEFTLTVSDGTATVSDKVTVTITDSANTAPTVNAGDDQEAAEGATVSLDATVADPDTEDTLAYTWSHNSTLSITFTDVEDPSFTAPNVAEDRSRVHPDRVRRHGRLRQGHSHHHRFCQHRPDSRPGSSRGCHHRNRVTEDTHPDLRRHGVRRVRYGHSLRQGHSHHHRFCQHRPDSQRPGSRPRVPP